MDGKYSVRAFAHGAMGRRIDPSWSGPIELFLVPASVPQLVYPVCGVVHIKEPLLLIEKSSLCGGSGFPLSLSESSLTICLTPYNRKQNVLSASLNKTYTSFIPSFHILIPAPTQSGLLRLNYTIFFLGNS